MIVIEIISLVLAILFLAGITIFSLRHRKFVIGYAIPPLLYFGHVALFYVVVLSSCPSLCGIDLTPDAINAWSSGIRLQGGLTIIILFYAVAHLAIMLGEVLNANK